VAHLAKFSPGNARGVVDEMTPKMQKYAVPVFAHGIDPMESTRLPPAEKGRDSGRIPSNGPSQPKSIPP
jgi:hypothetical protein